MSDHRIPRSLTLVACYRAPQIMMLAIDPDEDFIDVEGVAIAPVLTLQAAGINGTELYAP